VSGWTASGGEAATSSCPELASARPAAAAARRAVRAVSGPVVRGHRVGRADALDRTGHKRLGLAGQPQRQGADSVGAVGKQSPPERPLFDPTLDERGVRVLRVLLRLLLAEELVQAEGFDDAAALTHELAVSMRQQEDPLTAPAVLRLDDVARPLSACTQELQQLLARHVPAPAERVGLDPLIGRDDRDRLGLPEPGREQKGPKHQLVLVIGSPGVCPPAAHEVLVVGEVIARVVVLEVVDDGRLGKEAASPHRGLLPQRQPGVRRALVLDHRRE
jgi:hypothetical protein